MLSTVESRRRGLALFSAAGEGFVGLLDLFKALFGFKLWGIVVGMKLHRHSTIGLSNLYGGRISRNSENFIGIGNEPANHFVYKINRQI